MKVLVAQSCPTLLQRHELYPTRLLCPWDSPGKNTGGGCHFLLQGIFPTQESNPGLLHCSQILYRLSHQGSPTGKARGGWSQVFSFPCISGAVLCLVAQLCLILCDPIACSSPGSSVHGILQARILEWVAIPSSRKSFQPRNQTQVSCIAGEFFTV